MDFELILFLPHLFTPVSLFTQLNGDQSAFQRRFTKELMRLGEIDRRVAHLEAQLIANELPYVKPGDLAEESAQVVAAREPSADMVDAIEVPCKCKSSTVQCSTVQCPSRKQNKLE